MINLKTFTHNDIIDVEKRDFSSTIYSSRKFKVQIQLLHKSKKATKFEYPDQTSIVNALETFSCVLTMNDK